MAPGQLPLTSRESSPGLSPPGSKFVGAEAFAGHPTGPEVLDEHVCRQCEVTCLDEIGIVVEVKRDPLPVAVDGEEVGARAVPGGRLPMSCVVAGAWLLDLDDVLLRG